MSRNSILFGCVWMEFILTWIESLYYMLSFSQILFYYGHLGIERRINSNVITCEYITSVCLSVCLSIFLSVYLCLFFCLFISICLSICPFSYFFITYISIVYFSPTILYTFQHLITIHMITINNLICCVYRYNLLL